MPRNPREATEEEFTGETRRKVEPFRSIIVKYGHLHPQVRKAVKEMMRVKGKTFLKQNGQFFTLSCLHLQGPWRPDSTPFEKAIRKHGLLSEAHAHRYALPATVDLAGIYYRLEVMNKGDIKLKPH